MAASKPQATAQAVLDTRALDVAHEALAGNRELATALEMHLDQCKEREERSERSRAAIHTKIDSLRTTFDQEARDRRRRELATAGATILTLLTVIGTLIAWIVAAAPWAP